MTLAWGYLATISKHPPHPWSLKQHTGTTESVDNLISLLLIVEFPSLFEGAYRLGVNLRPIILSAKVEAIEDENAADTEILEDLQFPLDVTLQGEWEATQRDKQRFAGGVVGEVLGEVVRRIDSDDSPFEGGEGERKGSAGSPFIQRTDCW